MRGFAILGAVLGGLGAAPAVDAQVHWRSGGVLAGADGLGFAQGAQQSLNQLARIGPGEPKQKHVVVQFTAPLSAGDRAELEASGIRLGSFLGGNSYFATLEADRLDAGRAVGVGGLYRAVPIARSWKLHPDLAHGAIRPWTVIDPQGPPKDGSVGPPNRLPRDPLVALVVLFHDDVTLDRDALQIVRRNGGSRISTIHSLHGLVIAVPTSRIGMLADEDGVMYLEPPLPGLTETNQETRALHGVDAVQQPPTGLDGTGVNVLVYDSGQVFQHADFSGRLTIGASDTSGPTNHSTHVAGTVAGDGSLSGGAQRGMAPGASIISFGFETGGPLQPGFLFTDPGDLEADYTSAINTYGVRVSNNSIGSNVASNGFPCAWEGDYGVTSALIDAIVGGSLGTPIPIVWSAGNERGDGSCGIAFRTIAPPSGAKNHIAIGAINTNDESIASFSSMGPTDDGRLKPDLVASGCQIGGDQGITSTSFTPSTGVDYAVLCGTSMAAPAVTGICALLLQDYAAILPSSPPPLPSTIKALLLHSARDLANPGPDYATGYGSVQAMAAVITLRAGNFREGAVSQGGQDFFVAQVQPGDPQLKLTIAWDDAPGTPNVVPSLVNDLDLVITSPSGTRHFPWTLGGVAVPQALARRTDPNRTDNVEQVVVDSPETGEWLVEVVGFSVPAGPQTYSLVSSTQLESCTDEGLIRLDSTIYSCTDSVSITVVDCGLNTDPLVVESAQATLESSTDPVPRIVTLTETAPDSATFVAVATLGPTGDVLVSANDMITARYQDADTGGGFPGQAMATASVDCTPPQVGAVTFFNLDATRAELSFTTDEPSEGTVRIGTVCGTFTTEISQTTMQTGHSFVLDNLNPVTPYFVEIVVRDVAGNVNIDDNTGQCYTFTTLTRPRFYTELFDANDLDLGFVSIEFTPSAARDPYHVCTSPISVLPTDPLAGTVIVLQDDVPPSQPIELQNGRNIILFGSRYSSFYPNPNGNITFVAGDQDFTPTFADHFAQPRVSGLFVDLSPVQGGTITWQELSDRVVLSYVGVPQYLRGNSNTFQYEFFFDGRLRLSYLQIDSPQGLVGLSAGGGIPVQFNESDLSAETSCPPIPPWTVDTLESTPLGTSVDAPFGANDDGLPGPLAITITALPTRGRLFDPMTSAIIDSVPYTLPPGVGAIHYAPTGSFRGVDRIRFFADDGGSAPTGGASPQAVLSIRVGTPTVVASLVDGPTRHPGWTFEALWQHGVTLGQGGSSELGGRGAPDPLQGITSSFVLGYNLQGNYEPNLSREWYATVGPIDCSQSQFTKLVYQRWLGVERNQFDRASVEISADAGLSWIVLWSNPPLNTLGGAWEPIVHDISAIADGVSGIRIRFGMGPTDSAVQYAGWSLDQMSVTGLQPLSECPGDTNLDRVVTFDDLNVVLSNWGRPGAGLREGDADGNGTVDFDDVTIVLSFWEVTCP